MSWALPTDRAVEPAPRANINQVARDARPTATPADAIGEPLRRFGPAFADLTDPFRRAGAGRAGRDAAFDLAVFAPDRAAVLLAMGQA